jgi:hypothetical protein
MIHFTGPKSGAKGETWSKVYQDEWMAIHGEGVKGDVLPSRDLDKKLESHGRVQIKESKLNEAKFYITYNKGRGQGKALLKSSASNWKRPQVFNSYKDAEKYIGNENKVGMTAYWVSDDKMNRVNKYGEIKESSGMIKLKDIWSD